MSEKNALVMGLGVHGGGIASARFLVSRGMHVTVTDLRTEKELESALDQLAGLNIRYRLGEHRESDFREADFVVKNPAVPVTSRYLKLARRIETDISLFLREYRGRLVAVTGSKGKSTTVSALAHILKRVHPHVGLAGNITFSPLNFLMDDGALPDPVVLELSSWQLGDLKGMGLLKPDVAVLTAIMPDHQNRYDGMEDYVDDKKQIYRDQSPDGFTLCLADQSWGRIFYGETPARGVYYTTKRDTAGPTGMAAITGPGVPVSANTARYAWLNDREGFFHDNGTEIKIVPADIKVPGIHNRQNLLAAAAAAYLLGCPPEEIRRGAADFPGVPHRLEYVGEADGVRYFNDTTATIPQAVVSAVESLPKPLKVIMGGTDKSLDFSVLDARIAEADIILLEGSATDKLIPVLDDLGAAYSGPFKTLEAAFDCAQKKAQPGSTIVLSPGCASFGMFKNEFDRGDQFRELVRASTGC